MQNTLVHIHKDISLPFYIYLYLCTALSLLKWYPVVDFFFFQFYFSTLLTLITKGLDKELLSPPPSMHIVYLQFLQLCIFKIMWGLRLREGGTKVVWEGGVLVKLPLKTFFLIILTQKWKQMPFFPISLSLPSVQPRGDSTSTRKSTLQGK